ncbi:fibronectin type III domain-containing protein [Paenibacillus sp. P25]|nr:fibronectin type III domain-containing protein [Paenibacillus sp. P25]
MLGEEIGNGDAILNHVKVNGQTIIKGGGDHSVHLQDTVLLSVIIDKRSGAVRVVAEGATSVQQTTLQSSVILENSTGTDAGFNNVTVDQSMPANSYVSLRGDFNTVDVFAANIAISVPSGLINSLQVRSGADNASLDLGGSDRISNLLLNAVAAVTGTGGISNAWLNVSGISFEYLPDQYGLGAGVQEPSHGSSNATLLQYINVSNGAVQLNFNRPLADATLDDFAVTAKLNGQPYVLENLAYDAAQQKLTFKQLPADQYHMQELSIAVAPSETTTKFSRRSVLTTIKITGFEGTVWDVNNNPVSGMTIRFRDRAGGTVGPVLATVVTDANGRYKVTLPPGLYTGELVADGFIPGYVVGQASLNWYYTDENATAIRIPGENETRIVLVWGEVPRDLDSHLVGPTPDAASHFHTWYGGKIYSYNNVVFDDLDHDDVTAYGPETTTIRQNVYGTYRFYVHNYSGENSLRTSQAEVKVYRGNNPEPVESYQVPTGTGTERYWAVFDMNISESGITFTDINQLMTTADQADGGEVNVATVTSRVYSVNNSLNTIGGVAAGISTAAFKAGLSPSVTGVTYDVYAPGSSIAKTGPIISGDQLIVKAANGITKKLYTIVTSGMAVDTEAPQQVANLTASNVTATSLTLSWSPSTDNMPGGVRYAVYSGGTYLTTVTGTTYQVTGLTAGQSYSFTVKAFDTAGNYAPASNPFTVDTLVSLDAVTDSYALNRNVPETDHGQLAANEVESGGVGQAQEVSNSMLLFPSGAIEV